MTIFFAVGEVGHCEGGDLFGVVKLTRNRAVGYGARNGPRMIYAADALAKVKLRWK